MINGVEIINSHPRAVVVELFLIHETLTVLINPNESRLLCNHSNACFNPGTRTPKGAETEFICQRSHPID